jgi:iron complex transport system ATP-binding protein
MSLTANNISVSLRGKSIIRGLELEVNSGEVVGLIGPNGAGKSTLLKACMGFHQLVSGQINISDQKADELEPMARAKFISYLAQGHMIHWPMEAERLVGLGRLPHLDSWTQLTGNDLNIVRAAMEKTDCWHLRSRIATTLSGGERSAVLLARALAGRVPYLMLDEPTANLDPYHQLEVMEILRAEAKGGTGVVTVLHDLGLAARFCDKLYLIKDGELVAKGVPGAVLSEGNLKEAYRIRVSPDGAELSSARMERIERE